MFPLSSSERPVFDPLHCGGGGIFDFERPLTPTAFVRQIFSLCDNAFVPELACVLKNYMPRSIFNVIVELDPVLHLFEKIASVNSHPYRAVWRRGVHLAPRRFMFTFCSNGCGDPR